MKRIRADGCVAGDVAVFHFAQVAHAHGGVRWSIGLNFGVPGYGYYRPYYGYGYGPYYGPYPYACLTRTRRPIHMYMGRGRLLCSRRRS